LVGLTVEEAMLLSWHELFDQVNKMEPVSAEEQTVVQIFLKKFNDDLLPFSMLPAQLVRLALSEYLGIAYHPGNLPSKSVIGRSNEHLVCRCFGVSNKALEKYFQQHSQATLAQVSGDINAGAGCGHCHEDIELISAEFCPNPIEIHINDGRYIGECLAFGSQTPASVALLVHDYLEKKWPGTHIIRCAGRRLELAPHTSRYVAMVEAIEQIRLELADILGSRPFILIHQQH
jgi:bacterioferritin-associated ferredoxin